MCPRERGGCWRAGSGSRCVWEEIRWAKGPKNWVLDTLETASKGELSELAIKGELGAKSSSGGLILGTTWQSVMSLIQALIVGSSGCRDRWTSLDLPDL